MAEVTINIGDFNEALTLKECVKTKGDKAQIVTSYIDKAKIYADVEVLPIAEQQINDNSIMQQKIIITTYPFEGLCSKWMVDWKGDIYDILSISPIKGTVFTKIEALKI